jgi:opacity protein-like surface antigen
MAASGLFMVNPDLTTMVNNATRTVSRKNIGRRHLREPVTMKSTLRIALLLATVALPFAAANAADYDPPIYVEDVPTVPIEVGSGWYLRGDVAYNFARSHKDSSIAVDDWIFDEEVFGLGWLGPIEIFSESEKHIPVAGSIGFGYHFNDYLRAEVNIGLLSEDKHSVSGHLWAGYLNDLNPPFPDTLNPAITEIPDFGCVGARTVTTQPLDAGGDPVGAPVVQAEPDWRRDCDVSVASKRTGWNGLANGYVDLGTYVGITPYIGAGIGVLHTHTRISSSATCEASENTVSDGTSQQTTTFLCRGQDSAADAPVQYTPAAYDKSEYNLLYSLSAGASYKVAANTSIDIGYQYMSAPNLTTYRLTSNGLAREEGLDFHQFKIGLRYDLW